jgi:hypothetical protein
VLLKEGEANGLRTRIANRLTTTGAPGEETPFPILWCLKKQLKQWPAQLPAFLLLACARGARCSRGPGALTGAGGVLVAIAPIRGGDVVVDAAVECQLGLEVGLLAMLVGEAPVGEHLHE